MPRRVHEFRPALPHARVEEGAPQEGYFYTGEAARMLGLEQIDYHQIRRLFSFVREQAGKPMTPSDRRRWSRFTVSDLACLETLINLCGGTAALQAGRRLRIEPVRQACQQLRDDGFENPLLEVPMIRIKDQVFATIDGALIQPGTGQLAFANMLELVTNHLGGELDLDTTLRSAINAERAAAVRQANILRATRVRIT